MARKRGTFGKLVVLAIVVLAVVGAWSIYKTRTAQDGISAAERVAKKTSKAVKAARRAW